MIKKLLSTGFGLSLALGLTHCTDSQSISSTTNTENVVYLSISDSIDLASSHFRVVNSDYNTLIEEDAKNHAPSTLFPKSAKIEFELDENSLVLVEVIDTLGAIEHKSWVYLDGSEDSSTIVLKPSIGIKGLVVIPRINGFNKVYLQLVGTDLIEDVTLHKEPFSEVPIDKDTAHFDYPLGIGTLPENQNYLFRVFWEDAQGKITKSNEFEAELE
ncbi:hypothetical protein OAU52_00090 [bacterium]|nr:hypothetical protein [bacterium]